MYYLAQKKHSNENLNGRHAEEDIMSTLLAKKSPAK